MAHSTHEKACIKMIESSNRLKTAVESLKKDIRYDIGQSEELARRYEAAVQHAIEAKIVEKPFHSVIACFAVGFLVGKWLKKRRACSPCCSV